MNWGGRMPPLSDWCFAFGGRQSSQGKGEADAFFPTGGGIRKTRKACGQQEKARQFAQADEVERYDLYLGGSV